VTQDRIRIATKRANRHRRRGPSRTLSGGHGGASLRHPCGDRGRGRD
jgi:hypothetical protein